ncbi:hypothetical protein AADG42_03695 [Ammonicoccus fulvus]|uniref:Secreted protein n=1 Tax=Ammonicoccus fulvus TaxID=3138240 RepID=A0ABZ3FK89_9ACTN
MRTHLRARLVGAALIGVTGLALSACSGAQPAGSPGGAEPDRTSSSAPEVTNARLGITYDGGVMIVEEETMKHLGDLRAEGQLSIRPAGDQRHLLVSVAEGFRVLDTGVEVRGHDDHVHLYGHDPKLTDVVFPAPKPGHAVVHDNRLALFSDEAGTIQVLDPHDLLKGPAAATTTTVPAHHGVAVPTADGLIVSRPEVNGVNVLDASGAVRATTSDCPKLHGEATANEAVTFGCADGTIIVRDAEITKVTSPDAGGRMATQVGSHNSDIVLADYRLEGQPLDRVALVDTESDSIRVVQLPAPYSSRSLGRVAEGQALVLTTDGNLHIINEKDGSVTGVIKVIEPWIAPEKFSDPRPALRVVGNIAYVTEPASSKLHAVHLPTSELVDSVTLPHVPNQIADVGLGAEAHHHD